MSYLPEFYREFNEFAEIDQTESVEFDDLETAIQRAFDNRFVMTSDAEAVKRREKMLGIQADPTTETLEFRKKRLINRYSTKPPFTKRYLQEHLDALVGPGMTIVSVDVRNFILYVTANIENAKVFREVIHTVETVKPANMVYQQNTSLRADIGLQESIRLRPITWNYRLGSWQLVVQPFATLGEEEVVK